MPDQEKLKLSAEAIIKAVGEDINDPNFKDTPNRFAKAFAFLFKTPKNIEDEVAPIMKTSFPTQYNGLIFCDGLEFTSFCPHHLLPIRYEVTIGYIPSEGMVIGASKLARVVELYCKRAMLQEELTYKIADTIEEYIKPVGVAILIIGYHDCMRIRGIMQKKSRFKTSEMRGSFKTNPETREEFFHLIANGD